MRAMQWPGSPHPLTKLTSIHFMSIRWPWAQKEAAGYRKEWGGPRKKTGERFGPSVQFSTGHWRVSRPGEGVLIFRTVSLRLSTSVRLIFSSSQTDFPAMNSFLGHQCWRGRHIWACSWTKVLQEIKSPNAHLGLMRNSNFWKRETQNLYKAK